VGFKGEKTFEQPLIASRPGPQTLPGVAFSYFDPNTRHYETARSTPLKVTISPSLADSTLTSPQAPAGAASSAAPAHGPSGLRPDHAMAESLVHSLVPLYMQPRFLALPSLLALAFAAGWLGLRHRAAVSGEPKRRERLSKAANRLVKQMELAAGSGDAALFLNSARAGLQQALAARWQLDPDRVTTDELEIRLGDGGDDGNGGEAIRQIFALADEANYSGHEMTTTDYERWTQIVRQQLASGNPT
jgi:hypothetical protein